METLTIQEAKVNRAELEGGNNNRAKHKDQREELLICFSGIFEIKSGVKRSWNPISRIPKFGSVFQFNHKLYVGGGYN